MEFNANENLNVSLTHLDLSNYTEEKEKKNTYGNAFSCLCSCKLWRWFVPCEIKLFFSIVNAFKFSRTKMANCLQANLVVRDVAQPKHCKNPMCRNRFSSKRKEMIKICIGFIRNENHFSWCFLFFFWFCFSR